MTGKKVSSLLWTLAMAGTVIMLLATANWLPSLMQKGFVRKYDSMEEVKRSLDFEKVLVPAYFPEGISWPPSLILAQSKPYTAIVTEFRKAGTADAFLVVTQTSLRGNDARLQRIKFSEVRETTEYPLKGKKALLQTGICGKGIPCSRIMWQDSDLRCTVLLMSSPFELIKIAESMIL